MRLADTMVTTEVTAEEATRVESLVDEDTIEKLMFSNEKVEKFDDREPDVLMPMEENPRVQAIAKKERFGFDAKGKPVSKNKVYQLRDGLFEAIIDRFYKAESFRCAQRAQKSKAAGCRRKNCCC